MDLDLRQLDPARAYRYLAGVVVPRPIALVTTLGPDGHVNAAPFSFFNLVGSAPPVVALGVGDRTPGRPKDTRANILRTGEFVVNLVDEPLAPAMNVCGMDFPPGESELDAAGLSPAPSLLLAVPRIAQSPVSLECRLATVATVGDNEIILGEVVALHIRDEFVDPERDHVRADALGLIGRMHGGGWYARTGDLFEMPRIPYAQWKSEASRH